jgi:hypothetical protein
VPSNRDSAFWTWVVVAAVVVFLFWNGNGDPVAGVEDIYATITRGARLTRAPYDTTTGVVPGTPDDLASQANLTSDQYALARMVSSEEGQSSNAVKGAVCWATINYAAKVGKTVTDLLTHATTASHSGSYGTFKDIESGTAQYGKADRYASTALDPYDGDGQIASDCLDGTIADPTGGAIQFDRPAGEKNPDSVATKRTTAGLHTVDIDGVDSSEIRFWAA